MESPKLLGIFDQATLSKLRFVVVDQGQGAAQQPACGIAHGNGDDFVPDTAHNKQINLPEGNEGREHDDHRCLAVAGTSERTGVDLVKAAKNIERSDPTQ